MGPKSKFKSSAKDSCQLPLGTLGWPLLGETIEFISCAYSDRPESFMDRRRRLYGKVFKSHIFGTPTIVSTDAEVSKFVLQSDAKTFETFYPKSLTELMGKSSILIINGSLHRKIHGLIGSFFKSPRLKDQITKDMQNYVQQSMDKWRDDQLIYIQDETKHAKKRMVKIIHKIIQSKRKSGISSTVAKDVADVLLNDASELFTDDLIADNIIDFMIPGEDSVPILMTLAIKYLSDCPAALHQLTEENMKLKRLKAQSGEPLIWSDYLSLPFTQSVITETLRMGNIIIGVMRKAMKDIEIKGWVAEDDTIVNFPTVRMKKRMPVWVKRRDQDS
ncbi:Cytochrome P450 [Corchorus capsularis]|uniref:Cytochrome P450 n=1 Tax=Corchorus capsularis TaxID=210143 RepID=A0A1R3HKM6_COCAP|nr:Cytochrome P450 [Corchorus capsularis]